MRYCAALCNCRYIHTLWCLATDLMCHSLPVFLSYSLLAGGYWEFHRGKPVPFAILDFWGARHLFVNRRSPRSSASCIIQNGGHEKANTGFLAVEKLQRLQVGCISCTISQKGIRIVLPAPLFLTLCVMCYTYERADFMSRLSPKQWARM